MMSRACSVSANSRPSLLFDRSSGASSTGALRRGPEPEGSNVSMTRNCPDDMDNDLMSVMTDTSPLRQRQARSRDTDDRDSDAAAKVVPILRADPAASQRSSGDSIRPMGSAS